MLPVIVFFVVLIAVIAWCMGYLGGFPAILKKMNDETLKCSDEDFKKIRKLEKEDNWMFNKIRDMLFSDSKSFIDDNFVCSA